MKRISGLLAVLLVGVAGGATAQGRGGMAPLPEKWISADSLAQVVGVTDGALVAKFAPHLAAVDQVMGEASAERQKVSASMQGGGRPDMGAMQAMRTKAEEQQKSVDEHLAKIRELLPEVNRAAFDSLPKPRLVMQGRGGRRGG